MKFVILMSVPTEMNRLREVLEKLNPEVCREWVWTHDVNVVREMAKQEMILLVTSEVIYGARDDVADTSSGTELARELKAEYRARYVLLYTCLRPGLLGEKADKQTFDGYVCKKDSMHAEVVAAFMDRVVTKQYDEHPWDSLVRATEMVMSRPQEKRIHLDSKVWVQ